MARGEEPGSPAESDSRTRRICLQGICPMERKRILDIGIGLSTHPQLLLLDEPASGLVGDEIVRVTSLIRDISSHVTVVLVEHNIDVVLSISDWITVLYYGQVIAERDPERDSVQPECSGSVLGGHVLRIEDLHTYYGNSHVLQGVSLSGEKGEIATFLGRNGWARARR